MFSDFYHVFYYTILFLTSLGSLFLFFKIENAYRWISLLLLITLISELSAKYVAFVLHIPNSTIYHIFVPIEFVFYAIIFSKFMNSKIWNTYLVLLCLLLVIAEFFNTTYLQPINESNTNIMILESVILVFLSLMLFLRIKESTSYENLLIEGIFWFNSGVLMYYAFNILVWGFHSIKVYNMINPPNFIYSINLIFCGLLYIAFYIAIYLNSKYMNQIKVSKT